MLLVWLREKLRSAREFLTYSAKIQRRAIGAAVRSLRRQFWPEVVIVLATAIASAFIGPLEEWLARLAAGMLGGLLAILVLVLLHYIFHLTVSPYKIFLDVETELARFARELPERPTRGFWDFAEDIEKHRSVSRLIRCLGKLSDAATEMTDRMKSERRKANRHDKPSQRVKAFRRLAKTVDYNARRLGRVHVELLSSSADFDESYTGYIGPAIEAGREDPAVIGKAVQYSLRSTRELKDTLSQARESIDESRMMGSWDMPVQGDYFLAAERLMESISAIEETLGNIVESHNKVLEQIKKGRQLKQ